MGHLFLFAISVVLPLAAQPAIAVRNGLLTVNNGEAELIFEGLSVRSFRNLITDERYISKASAGWYALLTQNEGLQAPKGGAWEIRPDPATGQTVGVIVASEPSLTLRLTVGIAPDREIFFRMEAKSPPGLRSAVWGMQGFDPKGRFVIPGQAGITFDINSPQDRLFLEYPTHWEAQFLVYEGAKGSALLYARDPSFWFKRLWADQDFGTLDFALEVFAAAPWASATEIPVVEWRLKVFDGKWRSAADHYRRWTQTVWPERHRTRGLEWVNSIRAVISITDARPSCLDELAEAFQPNRTVLLLKNWRRDPYDVNYPDYTPADGIAAFVEQAQQKGFRVMLHANALGVAQYHPAYSEVSRYQLRIPEDGSPLFWPFGLWPGGAPPPDYLPSFAFISPAASKFRRLLADALAVAVEALRPDAIHLDAGGVLINDANGEIEGMGSVQGMIQLHIDLAERFPDIAFSYESITEALVPYQNFAQRWSSEHESHPVCTYLFGDRIRFYGFLDQENPDEPGFINYIRRYESQGILPIIHWDREGGGEMRQRIVRLLRRFQENQFQPDWDGDWRNLKFRYLSEDGLNTAAVEDFGDRVKMRVGEETVYERVRRASAVETEAPIRGWPAFDGNRALGLDPAKEYWLDESAKWAEDRPHIVALGPDSKVEAGTLTTPDYALFAIAPLAQKRFDFAKNFASSRFGVIYSTYDLRALAGGAVDMSRSVVGGRLRSPALAMRPPTQLQNAAVYAEYEAPVPDASVITLRFEVGLSDFGTRSDGAIAAVWVEGTRAWRAELRRGAPVAGQVDLSPWRGRSARIRFLVHAGAALNPVDDLIVWSDLALEAAAPETVSCAVQMPETAAAPEISVADASYDAAARSFRLDAPLSGSFAVFTTPASRVERGSSLLRLRLQPWNRYYGGLAVPAAEPVRLADATVGGESSSDVLSAEPKLKSVRVFTLAAKLPPDASRLLFRAGLADLPADLAPKISYSGVEMSMKINGEQVWSQEIRRPGWNHGALDISKWAGKSVIVELATDSQSNPIGDVARWAGFVVD
jgi:hypothetical protein